MANEVTITVKGRDQGAKQAMQSAEQQATGFGKSVQRVGEIAQGIIAAQLFQQIGTAAQEFLNRARDASSNLGESMNAVNVVFKQSADGIHQIGSTAATSMGLSQQAFNEAAVRFSNFAAAVAGPGGDVTSTIEDITQRATDFASVMNLDVEQALQVFQSGLAGESEPLRRYGIDVSAAAVQTHAYAEGIAEAGAELTEAQKIQARYGLIMQQTAEMAGDFAETSNSLANQQRILNAEWENANAAVGNLMVPALEAMNAVLIPLVQAFNEADPAVQVVIGSLVLLGAGAVRVTTSIAPMIISMNAAGVSAGQLATRARAAAFSVTSLGVAVAAAGVGILAWGTSARHTSENISGLTEDVERFVRTGEQTASLRRLFGEGADGVAEFADKLDVATAGWLDWSDKLNRSFDEISQAKSAFKDLDTAMAHLVDQGTDADEIMQQLIDTYDLSEAQVNQLRGALPKYSEAAERAADRTADLAGAQDAAAESAGAAAEEFAAAAQEMAESWGESVDQMIDANEAFQESDQETTASFIEQLAKRVQVAQEHNANITTIAERASGKVRELMLEDARENPELAALMVEATDAEWARLEELYRNRIALANDAANDAMVRNIPALEGIARQSGRAVATELAGKIREGAPLTVGEVNKLMGKVKTRVEGERLLATIRASLSGAALTAAERQLGFLARDRTAHLNVQIVQSGGVNAPQVRASGGVVGGNAQDGGPRGGTVLVNEQGPELARLPSGDVVDLPFGTTVIPAGQSQALLGEARQALAAPGPAEHATYNYNFAPGSITLDASRLRTIQDLIDLVRNVQATARQYSAGAVASALM